MGRFTTVLALRILYGSESSYYDVDRNCWDCRRLILISGQLDPSV